MEQTTGRQALLWETGAHWLWQKIRQDRVPICTSMILGLLCYLFAFTNKQINHDEVYCLFSKGGGLTLGRWGLAALDGIFPNYSMPWIYGILSLVLMTAAICLIGRLFPLGSKVLQGLLAGAIISFPTMTATVAYMYTLSSYALAFLLAVTALGLLQRGRRFDFLLALGSMILSLSIYQAYIAVAASLLVLLLIQRLLQGEPAPGVVKQGLWFLWFLFAALGGYYLLTELINLALGIDFSDYASSSMGFDLAAIPGDILRAYEDFLAFFTSGRRGLISPGVCQWMHVLLLGASAVLLAFWGRAQKGRSPWDFLLLAALLALLPLAIVCMHLFTAEDAVHTLVLYSFVGVYVLAAVLADECLALAVPRQTANTFRRLAIHGTALSLGVIILCNTYLANKVSLNLHLRYENAYSFLTGLVTELKRTPGFDRDTRLAVIGEYAFPEFYYDHFSFTGELTGTTGFLPSNYSMPWFLEYYLGLEIPCADYKEVDQLRAAEEFAQMPVYPARGSSKMIGNYYVVKLSE